MSMPIQRQSESFGIFDDGPRYARDKSSYDLPKGLAALINTSGPRIHAGLHNTRTANDGCEYCGKPGHDWQAHPEAHRDVADWEREKAGMEFPFGDHTESGYPSEDDHDGSYWPGKQGSRLAVNTDGMNPDNHAYHTELPVDGPGPGRIWNPDFREYEPSERDERDQEGVAEDDESGYNWGPEPEQHYGALAEDFSGGDEDDPDWIRANDPRQQEHNKKRGEEVAHSKELFGSRLPFDRAATARRIVGGHDDLPPLPSDFHIPDSPEGQPDRSPGWLHRQFVSPHKGVWDIPEHELDDRWNKVYDTLGFSPKTREEWEAGRHTDNPSDKWDGGLDGTFGGGVKDYLTRAPMSKDEYARHREDSQNRAKGIADGLWGAMYPPEEEEGRKAVQNVDTVNKLMDNGWQPEHIKYDEDDQPYGHYQHPSGWSVTDHGGMYKEIGHAATPGESHDVINTSHNIDGQDYHEPFGPADAHNFIENQLHGDPEETGGTFQYLTQNDPRIKRYKPRQAAVEMQPLLGGGYQIGHRVKLPYHGKQIPGTVIGLTGPNTQIRWDDGQYSTEEPHNIQLL